MWIQSVGIERSKEMTNDITSRLKQPDMTFKHIYDELDVLTYKITDLQEIVSRLQDVTDSLNQLYGQIPNILLDPHLLPHLLELQARENRSTIPQPGWETAKESI